MTVVSELSPLSLTQFFYDNGELVRPARLFFTRPDTLDPITVYTDAGLGRAHPYPVPTGGKGRCPPVYVGTEPYRVRVFDAWGALVEEIPWLPGATPPAGAGGGSALTDKEKLQLIQTGDMIHAFSNGGDRTGFVRCNGKLLAHPSYIGTNIERASDDCKDLFIFLWGQSGVNAILPVLPSRGASALDDWNAVGGKAITLPDLRGRGLRGIDGMGAAEVNRLAGVGYTLGTDNLVGSLLGSAGIALSVAQLPAHTHGVTGSPTGITTGAAAVGITVGGAYADIGAAYTGLYLVQAAANITVHANYTGIVFTDPGHDHSISASVPQVPGSGGVVGSAFNGFSGAYTDVRGTGAYISDPSHTHPVTDSGHNHVLIDPTHAHPQNPHAHGVSDPTHAHVIYDPWHTHTTVSVGSGATVETIGPTMLVTVYIKL